MTMIKTRFYFELIEPNNREELSKEVLMPFLTVVGQPFRINLLHDGQLDFDVKEPPSFDLTNMTLEVFLGAYIACDEADLKDCIRDCQRVGWRNLDQEFEQTQANK